MDEVHPVAAQLAGASALPPLHFNWLVRASPPVVMAICSEVSHPLARSCDLQLALKYYVDDISALRSA